MSKDNKFDRFDFEQQILGCWNIITDLRDLSEGVLESDMSKDEITNVLMGLEQLYELRFNKLFRQFETLVGEHHKSLDGEIWNQLRDLAENREMDNNLRGFFGGGVSVEPKPNSALTEMWAELEKYQPFADRRGFGPEWKRMCEERTEEAADAAESATRSSSPGRTNYAGLAASSASWALHATHATDAEVWCRRAIKDIHKAIEQEEKSNG